MCCSLHFWRWSRSIFFFKNGWINYHKSLTKRFDGEGNLIGVTYLTTCRVVVCQDVHHFLRPQPVFLPKVVLTNIAGVDIATCHLSWVRLQVCSFVEMTKSGILQDSKREFQISLWCFFARKRWNISGYKRVPGKPSTQKCRLVGGYVKFPGGYQISNLSNTTCENRYPPRTVLQKKWKAPVCWILARFSIVRWMMPKTLILFATSMKLDESTSCEQNRTTSIPSWERWKISHSPKNTLRRWVSTFPHCFWGYASVPLEECINLHWPFWSEKVSTVFRSEKSPMLCASWCVLRLYCSLRRLGFKMRKKTGTRSGLVRNVGRSIWYDLTKISMTYEIVQDIVTR